jgi:large subunit ribosomal protein L33
MSKKKKARAVIKLKSQESSYMYTSHKNSNNTTERLELKKYDPTLRRHVAFKEAK